MGTYHQLTYEQRCQIWALKKSDCSQREIAKINNRAGKQTQEITMSSEGWLRIAHKALQMSGAQLARRLGVSRAQVSKAEKKELTGSVTIKTMQHMAEAM